MEFSKGSQHLSCIDFRVRLVLRVCILGQGKVSGPMTSATFVGGKGDRGDETSATFVRKGSQWEAGESLCYFVREGSLKRFGENLCYLCKGWSQGGSKGPLLPLQGREPRGLRIRAYGDCIGICVGICDGICVGDGSCLGRF